jgi:TorA maturation chaperone TorD
VFLIGSNANYVKNVALNADRQARGYAVSVVIESFGGLSRLAKALGHTHVTTVQGWRDRGAIPLKHHARVLDAARSQGIQLRRDDLLDEIPLAEIDDEDAARAQCYALLARLLAAPPSAELLGIVRSLRGDDDSKLGQALNALAAAAKRTDADAADREYSDLFIGLARGELLPYASYYLAGFLHEKPLAALRGDLARLGIAASDDVAEPEDHIAALCEVMSGLITGAFGAPAPLDEQRRFFETHIASWAPRFFEDLQAAKAAAFYMPVGAIGHALMDIESEAFSMSD